MPPKDVACPICDGELRKVPLNHAQLLLRCPEAKMAWRAMTVQIARCQACGYVLFFAPTNVTTGLTKRTAPETT